MPRDIAKRRTSSDTGNGMSEETTATRTRVAKEGTTAVSSGWSSDRAPKIRKTGGLNRFEYEEGKETLIKILEDVPFASYWQHWITGNGGKKRPYVCLINDCPLCNIGDEPKPVDCFNVVELGENGPKLLLWQCSPSPAKAIRERAEKPRTSPVNRDGLYWAVTKVSNSNGIPLTSMDPVKEDEIKADWGVDPLTPEQLEEFRTQAYTEDAVVKQSPRHELVDLANNLAD